MLMANGKYLNYDHVSSFSGVWGGGGEHAVVQRKAAGTGKREQVTDTMQETDPSTMIQLPSNFSLPL